jgi:hypothetical protein
VPTFARHETFHFREGWLRKGLLALKRDSETFSRPDATDVFGIGKNMVSSLRYWMVSTGLAFIDGKGMALGPLSRLICKHDPYLEDEVSLWAIHIELASNLQWATSWYFLFNHYPFLTFDEETFVNHLTRFIFQRGIKKPTEASLRKDFRCIVRTYAQAHGPSLDTKAEDSLDCPLTVLGLMSYLPNTRSYRFMVPSLRRLPALVVAYAFYRFSHSQGKALLRFEDCLGAEQSPGRLLRLDTETLYRYLELLESEYRGRLTMFSRAGGLSTVSVYEQHHPLDILERYYLRHKES